LRWYAEQPLPHTLLAAMNTEMVHADHRRGRTVNRVTESATRPLFQEEPRPRNDEVAMSDWSPFNPTSLCGQEPRNRAGLHGFGRFCIRHGRVSGALAKSRDGCGLSASATAGEVGLEIYNPKLLSNCDYAAPHGSRPAGRTRTLIMLVIVVGRREEGWSAGRAGSRRSAAIRMAAQVTRQLLGCHRDRFVGISLDCVIIIGVILIHCFRRCVRTSHDPFVTDHVCDKVEKGCAACLRELLEVVRPQQSRVDHVGTQMLVQGVVGDAALIP
jgi:hypothetical protein